MENTNLNTGDVIEVTPDIFEKAAIDFSEGNEYLKKLLIFCFENGIRTRACCSGHNGQKRPYIMFEFDEANLKFILKLLHMLSFSVIDYVSFIKCPGRSSNFSIYIQKDKYDEGFKKILQALQSEKEIDIATIDIRRQLIVKSLLNHSHKNSYIEIREYSDLIGIATPQDYSSIFPTEQKFTPWAQNSGYAECGKDNPELISTLYNLDSRTKHFKYISEHPYNARQVNSFWKNADHLRTISINQASTFEREFKYREKNVVIVDVLLGSSITSVAEEIMELHQYGQACIATFNGFKIDSRDYTSPDEIVQAYNEFYAKPKHKQNTLTLENLHSFINLNRNSKKIDDANQIIKNTIINGLNEKEEGSEQEQD